MTPSVFFSSLADAFWSSLIFFVPLGIVGVWRWSIWLLKVLVGLRYRPVTGTYQASVSVVTPVYNERLDIFRTALRSWAANGPDEIIAVVDYTDQTSIDVFQQFGSEFPGARLIVTEKPGKRPALADGVLAARSDIVALVDSDTIWESGFLPKVLAPFQNPRVGGVATNQRVYNPRTRAQKLFDIQLAQRFSVEMPFLATIGGVLRCLSGRTAVYRRDAVLPLLDDLVNETFWGTHVISGEDKRLTYLLQAAGWQTAYQRSAHVYTPGAEDIVTLLKQRLRWARNSWRADLRALGQRWTWRHPLFALYLADNSLQPFAFLLGPAALFIALFRGWWLAAVGLLVWWHVSRLIRLTPILLRRPRYIVVLPEFVIMNIVLALTRVYALFTMNTQGWITRWDKSRIPTVRLLHKGAAAVATALACLGLIVLQTLLPRSIASALGFQALPQELIIVDRLVPRERSTTLLANTEPSPRVLSAAVSTTIPPESTRRVTYRNETRTIELRGDGHRYTLTDIRNSLGPRSRLLTEVTPRQWELRVNIRVRDGARLELTHKEVEWLRLVSTPRSFAWIRADDSTVIIHGTKVTSWDPIRKAPDTNLADGRSYIVARNGSRMDLQDAEVAYLGYVPSSTGVRGDAPFGLTWKVTNAGPEARLRAPTGTIVGSRLHHNAYGLYARGAADLTIRDSFLVANDRYGVVLAAGTHGARVEGNRLSNNGRAGIVVTGSSRTTLTQNIITRHDRYGIVLRDAHGNHVTENSVMVNANGIVLNESDQNLLRENILSQNGDGIELVGGAQHNIMEQNGVSGHTSNGILVHAGADHNTIRGNTLQENRRAMTVASSDNDIYENRVGRGEFGITLAAGASGNSLFANEIKHQQRYGFVLRTVAGVQNFVSRNVFTKNRLNIGAPRDR